MRQARPDLWTTEQVATYLGIAQGSARKTLSRWGVEPYDREPGRNGSHRYVADDVRAAHASAPGTGNRAPRRTNKRPTVQASVEQWQKYDSVHDVWVSVAPRCEHGTDNSYRYYGCRCSTCSHAAARRAQERRSARLQRPVPDLLHGTPAGYFSRGCRCEACRLATRLS